jgi:hypothetical protein
MPDFEPGIECVEYEPTGVFASKGWIAAINGEADLDYVVDAHIGDQERCRQAPIEHQALQIGFAPEHLEGIWPCMLYEFSPTQGADEMHVDPLEARIEFRKKMRHALGAGACQHALRRAGVPSNLRGAQIDLKVLQQPRDPVGYTGILGIRDLRRIRFMFDPMGRWTAADPTWRVSASNVLVCHAKYPKKIRSAGCVAVR